MILIKNITVKNFLSYGNTPTKMELDKAETTLIVGKNGQGKSTIILDAVYFALFNKPYRKITRGLIPNSINGGGCLVELEMETEGKRFLIRRGIQPNIFDIVVNDIPLDQKTLSVSLQDHLESDILKLNDKTFGQTIVLGSSSYTPFMLLSAGQRREVVDDVLGVGVYTTMAKLAKEDLDLTKSTLKSSLSELENLKSLAIAQKKIVQLIEENTQTKIAEAQSRVNEAAEELSRLESEYLSAKESVDRARAGLPEDVDVQSAQTEYNKINRKISEMTSVVDKISDLHNCPTCLQKVLDEHKTMVSDKTKEKLLELSRELDVAKKLVDEKTEKSKVYLEASLLVNAYEEKANSLSSQVRMQASLKKRYGAELSAIAVDGGDVETEKEKLKELGVRGVALGKEIKQLEAQKTIQEASAVLLKDSGIKSRVVKEYLPVMNGLINKYLVGYNFPINFTLDENFDETVQSRGRQKFSYHSFSEGEKEKIDYSIMLALRKMGASKNSAHLNILILDEILDGSLDADSRVATLEMLKEDVEGSNIFVISHTESNPVYYDNIIKVEKKGDFSQISYIQE